MRLGQQRPTGLVGFDGLCGKEAIGGGDNGREGVNVSRIPASWVVAIKQHWNFLAWSWQRQGLGVGGFVRQPVMSAIDWWWWHDRKYDRTAATVLQKSQLGFVYLKFIGDHGSFLASSAMANVAIRCVAGDEMDTMELMAQQRKVWRVEIRGWWGYGERCNTLTNCVHAGAKGPT